MKGRFVKAQTLFALAILLGLGSNAAAQAGPAGTPAAAPGDPVKALVADWGRARLGAQEYLDAMPEDDINFKAAPEIRSFAGQWLHVAGGNYMFAAAVGGVEPPYTAAVKEKNPEFMANLKQSKASLRAFVLGSYDFVIAQIQKLDPQKLREETQIFRYRMSREGLLIKALEHHAHHRGQTTIYLRLKGITPPSERLF